MQTIQTFAAFVVMATLAACQSILPYEISRRDSDVDRSDFAAPDGYDRSFSPAAHNFRRATSTVGEPVRLGRASERFELRNGDCDGADCSLPRARAEIELLEKANPAQIGQNIWYGWSFYNDTVPAFTKENSLRLVFGQWTMGGDQRPIFRFIQLGKGEGKFDQCDPRVCSETGTSQGDLVVQLDDMASFNGWENMENDSYICRLFDLTQQRGKWVDLTVNTNFSTGIDGYLRIWVNGNLVCDYSGPVVSPASAKVGKTPGHRRGIYSSWDKRWRQAMSNAPKPRLVVYYDEFRTGSTRADVDVQIRLASSASAVD